MTRVDAPQGLSRRGSRVAAAVVTFDRRDVLARSLDALAAQTEQPGRIVVIDNASNDGTSDFVRAAYPGVHLVTMPDNTGAAGGFAEALATSRRLGFEWTWVFNDDDTPEPEALERMLGTWSTLPPGAGILSCARGDGAGGHHPLGAHWRHRQNNRYFTEASDVPVALDVVAFSGSLVSTRMLDDIGLPRADFFMMIEELEYCLRARQAGWGVWVVPIPLVTAWALGSVGRSPAWRGYYQTRNHLLMAVSNRSFADVFWWALRTAKLTAAAALPRPERGHRIGLRLRGAWDGLRGVTGRTVEPVAPESPSRAKTIAASVGDR